MKVKIFKNADIQQLENDINEWTNTIQNIKIINTTQSSSYNKFDSTYIVITIYYKTIHQKPYTGPR